jgi:hypothetical protein
MSESANMNSNPDEKPRCLPHTNAYIFTAGKAARDENFVYLVATCTHVLLIKETVTRALNADCSLLWKARISRCHRRRRNNQARSIGNRQSIA